MPHRFYIDKWLYRISGPDGLIYGTKWPLVNKGMTCSKFLDNHRILIRLTGEECPYCMDHADHGQLACQNKCLSIPGCVGISYSGWYKYRKLCGVCKTHELRYDTLGFELYSNLTRKL